MSRDAPFPSADSAVQEGEAELSVPAMPESSVDADVAPPLGGAAGRSIELHHFRYVIAAAEHGSFRQAARAVGVRVSTISRCIRDLEDKMGVSLFSPENSPWLADVAQSVDLA